MKTLIIFLNIWSFIHGKATLYFSETCVEEHPFKCGQRLQWFYDENKKRCLTKVDDTCPGLNRFPTKEACETRCVNKLANRGNMGVYVKPKKDHGRYDGEVNYPINIDHYYDEQYDQDSTELLKPDSVQKLCVKDTKMNSKTDEPNLSDDYFLYDDDDDESPINNQSYRIPDDIPYDEEPIYDGEPIYDEDPTYDEEPTYDEDSAHETSKFPRYSPNFEDDHDYYYVDPSYDEYYYQ